MFTLEIDGRPIAALNTASKSVAESAFADSKIRERLRSLVDGFGVRLWDGKAQFLVRESLPAESAELMQAFRIAIETDKVPAGNGENYVAFLLPVRPTKP